MEIADRMSQEIAEQALVIIRTTMTPEFLELAQGPLVDFRSVGVCIILPNGTPIVRDLAMSHGPPVEGEVAHTAAIMALRERQDTWVAQPGRGFFAVYRYGGRIIVGVAGLAPEFNQMYAGWIAELCYNLCAVKDREERAENQPGNEN